MEITRDLKKEFPVLFYRKVGILKAGIKVDIISGNLDKINLKGIHSNLFPAKVQMISCQQRPKMMAFLTLF